MELSDIKIKLKDRLSLGLNYGLQSVEEALAGQSILKDDIVTYKSQYNDLNKIASQGILGYEQVEIGYNKIRQGLIRMIDKIESADLANHKALPKVQNNELQNRKENFFELLKIHFTNLENIRVVLQTSYDGQYKDDIRKGREAVSFLYKDVFKYAFEQPRRGEEVSDIAAYAKGFFENKYPRMEAYMNTLGFILKYISEAEVDQGFFFGVVSSILSSDEKAMLLYFALGSPDPGFKQLLTESDIISERIKNRLLKEEHFDLL
ncbi:MAG TPA: hypothetical protein ENJ95_17190 [Bacteroidetes bacterium]|nr:hypothetical protein [Bacteroidota bacterium]